uniref:DUF4371 domain-containing protein n=1 Tax=Octopus bimaculoides TaxID=37653 RepID=A0A0L8FFJ6_OCTBM
MANRKVDAENRAFEIRWETKCMLTDIDGKPVCLNCEYNLKRHYERKQDKYKYLIAEQKQRKVSDRVFEMASDLKTQLIEKRKDFVAYFLAVDETTDTTDTAQLLIFICRVDSNLFVMEDILHGTTGKDLFEKICHSVTDMKLPWDKLVGLTTPAIYGEKGGLVGRIHLKMQEKNCAGELTTYYCIIYQETLCAKALSMEHIMSTVTQTVWWLSLGKVLNTVFVVVEEIGQFMDTKRKESKLQGRDRLIYDMYNTVKAFLVKLQQLNSSHFPCCQQHFADKLRTPCIEFTRRFSDFEAQKNNFELLRNQFTLNVETAPVQIQTELIELKCNGRSKQTRTLSFFGITYLCEQLFSVKMNKTSHRSRLIDEHLQFILRISAIQNRPKH